MYAIPDVYALSRFRSATAPESTGASIPFKVSVIWSTVDHAVCLLKGVAHAFAIMPPSCVWLPWAKACQSPPTVCALARCRTLHAPPEDLTRRTKYAPGPS